MKSIVVVTLALGLLMLAFQAGRYTQARVTDSRQPVIDFEPDPAFDPDTYLASRTPAVAALRQEVLNTRVRASLARQEREQEQLEALQRQNELLEEQNRISRMQEMDASDAAMELQRIQSTLEWQRIQGNWDTRTFDYFTSRPLTRPLIPQYDAEPAPQPAGSRGLGLRSWHNSDGSFGQYIPYPGGNGGTIYNSDGSMTNIDPAIGH